MRLQAPTSVDDRLRLGDGSLLPRRNARYGGFVGRRCAKNADGSVDIYIGPKPPTGKESNWIYTPAGKKWYPWLVGDFPKETAAATTPAQRLNVSLR